MRGVLSEEHLKLLHDTMEVALENFDVCLKLSDGENRERRMQSCSMCSFLQRK